MQELNDRYRKIVETDCKFCTAFRPTTPRSNCPIYKFLLIAKSPDLIEKEHLYLDQGTMCKGFNWNGKDRR